MNNYIKDKKTYYINLFKNKKKKKINITELSLIIEEGGSQEFPEIPAFKEDKEESKYWKNIC